MEAIKIITTTKTTLIFLHPMRHPPLVFVLLSPQKMESEEAGEDGFDRCPEAAGEFQ